MVSVQSAGTNEQRAGEVKSAIGQGGGRTLADISSHIETVPGKVRDQGGARVPGGGSPPDVHARTHPDDSSTETLPQRPASAPKVPEAAAAPAGCAGSGKPRPSIGHYHPASDSKGAGEGTAEASKDRHAGHRRLGRSPNQGIGASHRTRFERG